MEATLTGTFRRLVGPRVVSSLSAWRDEARFAVFARSRRGSRQLAALRSFRNRHGGERCFIIGNGPSLRSMDLGPLVHEWTFGLNRIYLLFDELGFGTDFLVSVNRHVLSQWGAAILEQPSIRFLSQKVDLGDEAPPDTHFLYSRQRRFFSTDPSRHGIWEGSTVTYVAMQLAYFMGFREVYLIGVDHHFQTTGPAHKLVESQEDDPNHFDPNYFGKGARWQLPDLATSELAYKMARDAYAADGRRVVNAGVASRLDVFPRAAYEDIIARGPGKT